MVSTVKILDPKYLGDELKNQQVRGRLKQRPWNFAKICYDFHPPASALTGLLKWCIYCIYMQSFKKLVILHTEKYVALFENIVNIPKQNTEICAVF